MVARSGLFVAPAASVGASPTDARMALSALIGTTAQQASGGVTAQSASTMAFTVPSSVWQLPDVTNAGASFLSATDPFVLTAAAGPGTGSRIDLICVKQNNIENGDADSRANVILVAGTAGAPGVAPAVPTGAWLYQTINVPTSAATAAACTVVSARPSTYAPLPIKATTLALLNLVTGQTAQHATVTNDSTSSNNGDYVYTSGGLWSPFASDTGWLPYTPTLVAGATVGNGTLTGRYRKRGKTVEMWAAFTLGTTSAITGGVQISLPVNFPAGIAQPIVHKAELSRSGVNQFEGLAVLSASYATAYYLSVSGGLIQPSALNATLPWTWGAGDTIVILATYESV